MQTTDDNERGAASTAEQAATPPPVDWDHLEATLFQHLSEKRHKVQEQVAQGRGHFVHYTSAEGMQGILSNKCVWMRSTTCMNDFSEVLHGYQCLLRAWNGDSGKALMAALNQCHPDFVKEIAQEFDRQANIVVYGSYVACFSEHDPKEDQHGRLSMWRAYSSAGTGVALVLNPAAFFQRSDATERLG